MRHGGRVGSIVCMILCVSFSAFAGIPAAGVVAKYLFSGNAADSSGNGNHGRVEGAVLANDRFGTPNRAYVFDGVNDYIINTSATGLPSGNVAKSMSIWFKSAAISPTATMMLVGFGPDSVFPGSCFQIGHYSSGWRINGYGDSYDWKTRITKPDYLDTLWHHAAVTYDGTTTKLYFDGTLKDSTTTFRYNTRTGTIVIGQEIDMSGWNFKGALDDIFIYNRALSEAEVRALYEFNDFGVSLIPVPHTVNRRPVFSWHPAAGATTYTIKIDTSSSFSNPLIVVPTGDTVYTPAIDLPMDTIYWKVVSDNNQNSSVSWFVIIDYRIPQIIPFSPDLTNNRRPTFVWHPVNGAATYTLVIDSVKSFSNPLITVPIADTSYTPLSDLPADTIYWKVKSDLVDTYSAMDWIIIISDSLPFLIRFNGAHITDNKPLFRWNSVPNATGYRIEIDTLRTFTSPYIAVPLNDTSYTPAVSLSNRPYFWRVSSSRNLALFSPLDSFVVDYVGISPPGSAESRGGFCRFSTTGSKSILFRIKAGWTTGSISLIDVQGKTIRIARFSASGVPGELVKLSLQGSKRVRSGVYFVKVVAGRETIAQLVRITE